MHASKIKPAACGARALAFQPTHFIIASVCTHTHTLSAFDRPVMRSFERGRKKMIFCSKEKSPLHEPKNDTPCECVGWAAVTSRGPHPLLIDSQPYNSWAVCLWVLGALEKLQYRAHCYAFCWLIVSFFKRKLQNRTPRFHAHSWHSDPFSLRSLCDLLIRPLALLYAPNERFFFWRRRLFYLVISLQVKETAEVGRLFFWTWDFVVNNYCCVRVPPLYGHWSIATWANSKRLIFQIEHRHKLFWQIGFKSTFACFPYNIYVHMMSMIK